MDDRQSQFIITVIELCLSASLAKLQISALTRDGTLVQGIPRGLHDATSQADQAGDSGYARTFTLDEHPLDLEDIIECTIQAPHARETTAQPAGPREAEG